MKIVQISNSDIHGGRFNGYFLAKKLVEKGVPSTQLVWDKRDDSEISRMIFNFPLRNKIRRLLMYIEKKISVQSLLYPFSFFLFFSKVFREAKIVHFHLIHNHFFSLFSLPLLTKKKKSVWTLHDPWAITGHCIHPFECKKWITGCRECPDLTIMIPMLKDRAALMWKIKKYIYQKSNIYYIVASNYMKNMIEKSPLIENDKVEVIPFGIDLNIFKPSYSNTIRSELKIDSDSVVIGFRASTSVFKGLSKIVESLIALKTNKSVTILTFDEIGVVSVLKRKFNVVELGWINDEKRMSEIFNSIDFFIMPSTQEAFGMMAIEAMACGKPIIVTDNTALPEIVYKGDMKGGIVVKQDDQLMLNNAVSTLVHDEKRRNDFGKNALKIAKAYYDEKLFIDKILKFYGKINSEIKK